MKMSNLLTYGPATLLIGGFYYLAFRNSPKHANMLLGIVAVCIAISYISPREKFALVGVGLGIIGVFVVMVQSRKVREANLQTWFVQHGFRRIDFSDASHLFKTPASDTIRYFPYIGELNNAERTIPFVMVIRYSSALSGKNTRIILDCAYYFNGKIDVDVLEKKFKIAKENTPHTNLWKSELRFFDLKDCEIFKPAIGGIVVSWRVPDTIEGYSERYDWIKNALAN